jgi:ATP-dependent Clp protease ATP-binding subunit ClpC
LDDKPQRYTENAARVMFFAGYQARTFGSPYIQPEHLLLAILREDALLTKRFIRPHTSMDVIWKQIEENTTMREKISPGVDLPMSEGCEQVLAYAAGEAEELGLKQIGTEHLLLGLLRQDKGLAAKTLKGCGIHFAGVREQVARSARTLE